MINIVEEQLKEIAELHKKNKELYMQLGVLQETLANVEKQLECWADKCNQLSAELENCKTTQLYEQKVQSDTIQNLEGELTVHTENEKKLKDMIYSMENSISWRLTRPLRYLRWMQLKPKDVQ